MVKGKSTLIGNYEVEVHRVRYFIEPYQLRNHRHGHRLGTVADTASVNRCSRHPYRCGHGSRRRGPEIETPRHPSTWQAPRKGSMTLPRGAFPFLQVIKYPIE